MSTRRIIANRFKVSDLEKDLLGRGGMGNVYRATDTQTGEPVAVKALSPGVVARDPDALWPSAGYRAFALLRAITSG